MITYVEGINMYLFTKFIDLIQNKGASGETNDILNKAAVEFQSHNREKRSENPNLQSAYDNPLEAIENNQKLRNAVLKKQRELGLNILEPNSESSENVFSTDLSKVKLNSKIHIALSNNNRRVNLLLIGKSGSGQTSFISYLTKNDQLQGAATMFAQNFQGLTFDLLINGGNNSARIHESPGMCSGFELPQLEEHWNNLIEIVNEQGGISIFLLLIKSNERVTSQFIDELEEFSELYFDDKEIFWKRTVVVFTAIDELTDCNTLKERAKKIQKQVNMRGLEKLKRVIDLTGKEYLYVSCFDEGDKQRIANDLINSIVSMLPDDFFRNHNEINPLEPLNETDAKNTEVIQILATKPQHTIIKTHTKVASSVDDPKTHSLNIFHANNTIVEIDENEPNKFLISEPSSVYGTVESSFTNVSDLSFLQTLTKSQLISLLEEMCKDKKICINCKIRHNELFPENMVPYGNPNAKKNESEKKWYWWY